MVDAAPIQPATGSSEQYRNEAYNATNEVSNLQTSAPSLLNQLKENLTGIFAKDNPLIGARNDSLANYMSAATKSRAEVLPQYMPSVEGRSLTLSPTQQDALTTARMASAFAPLAGYNEILKGMYGNIGDLVNNAGNIYSTSISAAQNRASSLMDLYKTAVADEDARRQASAKSAAGSGGVDIASILASLGMGGAAGGEMGAGPGGSLDDFFGDTPGQEAGPAQGNQINQLLAKYGPQYGPEALTAYANTLPGSGYGALAYPIKGVYDYYGRPSPTSMIDAIKSIPGRVQQIPTQMQTQFPSQISDFFGGIQRKYF